MPNKVGSYFAPLQERAGCPIRLVRHISRPYRSGLVPNKVGWPYFAPLQERAVVPNKVGSAHFASLQPVDECKANGTS